MTPETTDQVMDRMGRDFAVQCLTDVEQALTEPSTLLTHLQLSWFSPSLGITRGGKTCRKEYVCLGPGGYQDCPTCAPNEA